MIMQYFTVVFSVSGDYALRLVEVKIPKHTVRFTDVVLECRYELRGEFLYSVKWYKDGQEFFRYVPKDSPPAQVFELPGVNVDVSNNLKVSKKNCEM